MATIAELINSQRSSPVSYYAPRPTYPIGGPPAQSSRYTPPIPPAGRSDWSALEAFTNSQAGQEQLFKVQQKQQEDEGFFGSGFGKGLGFIINNPVTRVITAPLNYLQMGGRAATLGIEEAAEGLAGAPTWLQTGVNMIPGLGSGMTGVPGGFIGNVDTERTEADTRSNWSKVLSPNTTYGYGELLNPNLPKWASRPMGLIGDVAFDPLTYFTGGASRVVAGASHVDEAARALEQATAALRVAEDVGDAGQIARATERVASAQQYAARAPMMGAKTWEVPLPRNRIERANLISEMSRTPEGRGLLQTMPAELTRGGERGFQVMSDEAKRALGIQEPGLRFRGSSKALPGTRTIADLLNRGGGAVRAGFGRLPGATGQTMNFRAPKGMTDQYLLMTRGGGGDLMRAASEWAARADIRVGSGQQLARGNRILSNEVKKEFKGKSKTAIRQMVDEAETVAEPNAVNKIAAKLLAVYARVTGRTLNPEHLLDPNTYFPHLLDPRFRRFLSEAAKRKDAAALDFKQITGIVEDELLEDPAFYVDNLLQGSGFLEKARKFGRHADGTAASVERPQVVNIGGTEVTFTAGDVGHLNEQLSKAFPNYRGDFYDTDPVRVFEAYNKSLSRQAGRDIAARNLINSGNPLAFEMTGDIDKTRLALNEALAHQHEQNLIATAQGKYDPTVPLPDVEPRPVVPGSAEDLARRAQVEEFDAAMAGARSPEEFAAINELLGGTPPPAERFGGVDPNDIFVTTKSNVATETYERAAKRAAPYARAAAAEANAAEKAVRDSLAQVRETIITPLRTTIKETSAEITAVNRRLKKWSKEITDMGDLTPENLDEMTLLVAKVDEQILNAQTKLKRTAANWKGRATKAQRKAEAEMRETLASLRRVRDQAQTKIEAAPQAMRDELLAREEVLNRGVRDATEALLRKEMSVDVPYSQVEYDQAVAEITQGLEEGVDPQVLLDRYRKVAADVRANAAIDVRGPGVATTPEIEAARKKYLDIVHGIHALGAKYQKGGRMPRIARNLWNKAIAAKAEWDRLAAAGPRLTEYETAINRITDLEHQMQRARFFGTETLPETTTVKHGGGVYDVKAGPNTVNVVRMDEIPGRAKWVARAEWDKYTYSDPLPTLKAAEAAAKQMLADELAGRQAAATKTISKLQAERNRLLRKMQPGGKFYKQQQANDILTAMGKYDERVAAATVQERKVLDAATAERARRQESIIWASEKRGQPTLSVAHPDPTDPRYIELRARPGMRYMTAYGEDPSNLEGMGWGLGQTRYPEAVLETPQGVRGQYGTPARGMNIAPGQSARLQDLQGGIYDVAAYKMPGGELAGVPTPRTEIEAQRSLRSLIETGGAAQIEARAGLGRAERNLAEAEATLPGKLAEEQAQIAQIYGEDMAVATGPLKERVETYTNLASDLSDRRNLVAKRAETQALRDQIKANPKNTFLKFGELSQVIDDLETVARANPYLDDPVLTQIESLLHTHRMELERINRVRMRVSALDRVVADANSGKLGNVMIATLNNNWRALHGGLVNTGDIVLDAQLHKSLTNLFELHRQPKLLGRTFNAFTNLFKTYATLSPGFFVRNFIGGTFMNTADGVALSAQLEGAQKWHQFMKGGEDWLMEQDSRTQQAFAAAQASGAGGRFEEAGILAKTENRLYNFLSSNRATRWGQRAGTMVEGAMRLGMALDSIDKGMGEMGALQRITRVHFDYAQVSELDETMKQIIPFWTFMSRNLPLQIQEMWTNPRVYSYYDHLITNFSLPDEEFTPDYWKRQGAWRTPIEIGGNPLYLQPDLGFTRLQSDLKLIEDTLSGENPAAALAQTNPLIGGTIDFIQKRDSFYNRQYDDTDYTTQSGLVGTPVSLLAQMMGQTNEMGQVSDNFMNYLQSLSPTLNQAARLIPGAFGQEGTAQTQVKRARYSGFPIQLLTPEVQNSEYWRQWGEMQDEQDRQRAMIEEAMRAAS